MILATLFWVFARIGAITFGGGYAMVSLIERDLTDRGWLTATEFADIVAVSQTTPGPLALNVATYVGRQVAGIEGGIVASLGLGAPAFIITALVLWAAGRVKYNASMRAAVRGIRGAVLGLIATAVVFFLESSVLLGLPDGPVWRPEGSMNLEFVPAAAGVFLAALAAAGYFKQGAIRVILGAAALGCGAFALGIL